MNSVESIIIDLSETE